MSRLPNSKLRISAAVGVGNAAIVAGRGPTRGAEGIANGSLKWPLSARDGAAPNGEGGVPNHDGNVAGWGAGGGRNGAGVDGVPIPKMPVADGERAALPVRNEL